MNKEHMRGTLFRRSVLASVTLGAIAGGSCEPVPVGGGHFWPPGTTTGDAGKGPLDGASPADIGDREPEDAAGPGGSTGSGGGAETGGTTGSGGGAETGGNTGSGGNIGTGGAIGSGGRSASGGSVGSGGSSTSGGSNGSGGRMASGGISGSGGGVATGGSTGVLTGSLRVTVTTKAAGGQYAPRNVGAIWIADSGTKFVKSLYVWAERRRSYLSRWGSATSAAALSQNVVDAVTAATMSSHGARTAMWNGTNTSKVLMPDGAYKVCFELNDGGTSQYQCVDFNKSRTAQTLSPADTSSFTMRSIGYTP